MQNTADSFRTADKHYLVDTFQQFEKVLCFFVLCHSKMIEDKVPIKIDEEFIRNVFLQKYILKLKSQNQIGYMVFAPEPASIDENFETKGYFDIQIFNIYGTGDLSGNVDQDEYFVFECKRLKMNKKNQAYIKEGILRFLNGKYEALMNGMIAFIEQHEGIEAIVENLNQILQADKTIQTTQFLEKYDLQNDFEFCRYSKHLQQNLLKTEKQIYHLFFDYTKLIFA